MLKQYCYYIIIELCTILYERLGNFVFSRRNIRQERQYNIFIFMQARVIRYKII